MTVEALQADLADVFCTLLTEGGLLSAVLERDLPPEHSDRKFTKFLLRTTFSNKDELLPVISACLQ